MVGTLQWENTDNKTSVVLYGVGALVALWFSSTIVGAVNSVPLVSTLCPTPPLPNATVAPGRCSPFVLGVVKPNSKTHT